MDRQFNIKQFYVLPIHCIYLFYVDLKQTAIIFLYSINWLVFITEANDNSAHIVAVCVCGRQVVDVHTMLVKKLQPTALTCTSLQATKCNEEEQNSTETEPRRCHVWSCNISH